MTIDTNLTQATLDVIVTYMSDEIRERVHSDLAPCTPAQFLEAYIAADPSIEAVLEQEFRQVYA